MNENGLREARGAFRDCSADAFGGALHGRDIDLIGDAVFKNVSALAGGVIQSVGAVHVPDAVMQETSAPQISALKAINVSNVSVEPLGISSLQERRQELFPRVVCGPRDPLAQRPLRQRA